MNWLVKEEPTHYGFDALVKDRKAVRILGPAAAEAGHARRDP